jgi:hypothetical protein
MMQATTTSTLARALIGVLLLPVAHAIPVLPDFGAATFVPGATIDHPYFPLLGSATRAYEGFKLDEDGDLVLERFELTVIGAGPVILGVQTTAQRDRAFSDGLLEEDTFDFFAQDSAGNVWYLGEDVTNYLYDADDNLIGTNSGSSWRAGVNGALPGFIMPADLTVGFNYYQEFAVTDGALDQGTTFMVGELVSLGIGDFANALRVLETNELKPDDREFKYYAPGVGLILVEEGLNPNLQDPEARLELVSTVPVPATLPLLALGMSAVAWRRRRGA